MLMVVAGKKDIDIPTRQRVAAYIRRYLDRNRDGVHTYEALEKKLDLGRGTISRVMSLRSLGLDVVIKVNRRLGIDAEELLNHDPKPLKPYGSEN